MADTTGKKDGTVSFMMSSDKSFGDMKPKSELDDSDSSMKADKTSAPGYAPSTGGDKKSTSSDSGSPSIAVIALVGAGIIAIVALLFFFGSSILGGLASIASKAFSILKSIFSSGIYKVVSGIISLLSTVKSFFSGGFDLKGKVNSLLKEWVGTILDVFFKKLSAWMDNFLIGVSKETATETKIGFGMYSPMTSLFPAEYTNTFGTIGLSPVGSPLTSETYKTFAPLTGPLGTAPVLSGSYKTFGMSDISGVASPSTGSYKTLGLSIGPLGTGGLGKKSGIESAFSTAPASLEPGKKGNIYYPYGKIPNSPMLYFYNDKKSSGFDSKSVGEGGFIPRLLGILNDWLLKSIPGWINAALEGNLPKVLNIIDGISSLVDVIRNFFDQLNSYLDLIPKILSYSPVIKIGKSLLSFFSDTEKESKIPDKKYMMGIPLDENGQYNGPLSNPQNMPVFGPQGKIIDSKTDTSVSMGSNEDLYNVTNPYPVAGNSRTYNNQKSYDKSYVNNVFNINMAGPLDLSKFLNNAGAPA